MPWTLVVPGCTGTQATIRPPDGVSAIIGVVATTPGGDTGGPVTHPTAEAEAASRADTARATRTAIKGQRGDMSAPTIERPACADNR